MGGGGGGGGLSKVIASFSLVERGKREKEVSISLLHTSAPDGTLGHKPSQLAFIVKITDLQ